MTKSLIIIGLVFWTLLIAGCATQSVGPSMGDKNPLKAAIIVKQSGGAMMQLSTECSEKSFIEAKSDYIIEGQVKKKETRWNDDKTNIITYIEFNVDKYLKGEPFENNLISIELTGGCVDDNCESVEDQPGIGIFQKGESLKLYLFKRDDNSLGFVCGFLGVSGVDDLPRIINIG